MAETPKTTQSAPKQAKAPKKSAAKTQEQKKPKVAVLVIHGIGEQRPMATLNSFVDAVWREDGVLFPPPQDGDEESTFDAAQTWYKPDYISGLFELRRITTRGITVEDTAADSGETTRFDFFEYYWAHHMRGHMVSDLLDWLRFVFARPRKAVPDDLRWIWVAGWSLVGVFALGALIWLLDGLFGFAPRWGAAIATIGAVGSAIFGIIMRKILPIVGDAARYLNAAPRNIAIRQKIRDDGLKLLDQLHKSGDYKRIIVVGHSLGSVIAYDIVSLAWSSSHFGARRGRSETSRVGKAFKALERLGLDLLGRGEDPEIDRDKRAPYRDAQRSLFQALRADKECLWRVSDLVTIGSPLSKASVLLAADDTLFEELKDRRDLPTAPPAYEAAFPGATFKTQFTYGKKESRKTHHAAPFGPVVWTNIYVPHEYLLRGDIISGTVHNQLGPAIADVEVPIDGTADPTGSWLETLFGQNIRHTHYWSLDKGSFSETSLKAVRRALNLRGKTEEKGLWDGQENAVPIRAEKLGDV
ncbi:MAG: hypothetical protein AAF337_06215 [Pseudomonadota bacterium]